MVSTDSLADNTAFAEHNDANFPVLSDADRSVSEAYGVLSPSGYARRWTFYIGPDGTILRIDRNVQPASAGRDLVNALQALGVPAAGGE